MKPHPGWLEARLPIGAWYRAGWRDAPVPGNLTLVFSAGLMVAVALAVITLSGIWLGLAYVGAPGAAALSIARYANEVPFGWLVFDLHRDGVTMLFGVVYLGLLRGMYYGSYRGGRELAWILEVARFAVFLGLGFFGFAMSGGAGAQRAMLAMARHIAAIPLAGPVVARDFLGGHRIGPTSIAHMAMTHIAIGFLVLLIAMLGYLASRLAPPAHPDGVGAAAARIMVPQRTYTAQIFTAFVVFALIFAAIVTVAPALGYPPHVAGVPWYLLVFDGLSQAGRSPGGGVALGVAALVLLGALPWLDRGTVASGRYRPIYAAFVLLFALDVTVLGVATAAGSTGVMIAATIWVFVHFLVVTPLVTLLEAPRPIPGQPA